MILLKSVSLLVDDAAIIFNDFDSFRMASRPEEYFGEIIARDEEFAQRRISRGGEPVVVYFNGKFRIFSAEAEVGNVSACHRISSSIALSKSARIESHIYVDSNLTELNSIGGIVDHSLTLLRFLELVAGRRQNLIRMLVSTNGSDDPQPLEIYWCMRSEREQSDRAPAPGDLPIRGGLDPEEFGLVLANWLNLDSSRRDARVRFSNGFSKGSLYDTDRLIGAANMFDILPPEATGLKPELTRALVEARDQARTLFRTLPPSIERDSILNSLGRLGRPNLKHKIRFRVEKIMAAADNRLPELFSVVDEAVNWRNHYVHGSGSALDFEGLSAILLPFLTDTLEFVFAASEFIEAGWDFKRWTANGTSMTHPWGRYVVDYRANLAFLKQNLAAER
jgi:hypothetical protein